MTANEAGVIAIFVAIVVGLTVAVHVIAARRSATLLFSLHVAAENALRIQRARELWGDVYVAIDVDDDGLVRRIETVTGSRSIEWSPRGSMIVNEGEI